MIEFENEQTNVEQKVDNSANTLLDKEEFKNPENIAFSCRNVDLYYDYGEKNYWYAFALP